MGRESVRRGRTLVPRACCARTGGGHTISYQQVTCYLLTDINLKPALTLDETAANCICGFHTPCRGAAWSHRCHLAGEVVTERDRLQTSKANLPAWSPLPPPSQTSEIQSSWITAATCPCQRFRILEGVLCAQHLDAGECAVSTHNHNSTIALPWRSVFSAISHFRSGRIQ